MSIINQNQLDVVRLEKEAVYPNSMAIFNDFPTIEKLNIFFKPYFE